MRTGISRDQADDAGGGSDASQQKLNSFKTGEAWIF